MAILLVVAGLAAMLYSVLAYGATVRTGENGRITRLGLLVGVGLTAAALTMGGAGGSATDDAAPPLPRLPCCSPSLRAAAAWRA